jgi:isoleucyl-tRNA synthetase
MAENSGNDQKITAKSTHAEREERILAFWKEKGIFEKSLGKWPAGKAPKGEFVFYEGPPTANGRPGIHHLEARAFKDAIPRYKTMQGFHVRRKGGWDTHGLPVELAVEKELGLKSKKEIETFGIEKFNDKCKESVWTYVHEWEDFTERMGYWVDLKDPYITYKPDYMESVWNVIKVADEKSLLYKDYKVVPWCPRCGTGLSSHELAQGYEDVKDLAVTVKFKVKAGQKIGDFVTDDKTFILAWTTTPWTLPGNTGLAVSSKIQYEILKLDDDSKIIFARDRFNFIPSLKNYNDKIIFGQNAWFANGSELVGLSYESLYPFEKDNLTGTEKEKLANAFKVYPANFVTTEDGTGIVHIAPMYGQDDFELGTKVGLPKYHLVNDDGTFKKETGFLAGRFVKDEAVAVDIIKDLAGRGLLFDKEKHGHSYPFCWRCHTPLIYFARDSWYLRMSELRSKLIKENESIHWEPDYIKEGRFGEWLREVKDWAISRERYWGTPLPVWICDKCGKRKVVGSIKDLETSKSSNKFFFIRHGESENNVADILNGDQSKVSHLTALGKKEAGDAAKKLKSEKIDVIYASPFMRTQETAAIIAEAIGYPKDKIITDSRLREQGFGELEGHDGGEYNNLFESREDYFTKPEKGVETRYQAKQRVGSFLEEVDRTQKGKNIIVVSHSGPIWMMISAADGLDMRQTLALKPRGQELMANASFTEATLRHIPRNHNYELDLHKPYIDEVKLSCACGGEMKRVKEVMDVWFDSGAMPFAEDHYPFENKKLIDGGLFKKAKGYPADFISEAIDQTRGWFYTLHAIGTILGKGKAFKNVICLGHILDSQGKKMSKHIGNVVSPWVMMDKYGADALRFWMYSINQPGEPKNFDEKTVDEIVKKVFNLISNTAAFYAMYAPEKNKELRIKNEGGVISIPDSSNVLDRWIIARLNQVVENATTNLDQYVLLEPARAIRDFAADLSQWYLRRSRDRFKGGDSEAENVDKKAALATMKYVLLTLAKVMAPFAPFFAEELYQNVGGEKESVHLEEWPVGGKVDDAILAGMLNVRSFATMIHMQRTQEKIPVRQPLFVNIKHGFQAPPYWDQLKIILKDEVNAEDIILDPSMGQDDPMFKIDTNITPALKEKGDLRELLRKIQDLRKEKGLKVGDKASLIVPADSKALTDKYGDTIKKSTSLSSIEIGDTLRLK